jgi:hypothetical protein
MLEFTFAVADRFDLSLFSVMEQDSDRIILLINYYIYKAEQETESETKTIPRGSHDDGFWDF